MARILHVVFAAFVLAAAASCGHTQDGVVAGEWITLAPERAQAGAVAVVELTVSAPAGVVLEVSTEKGRILGVIRPFGPADHATFTVPATPTGQDDPPRRVRVRVVQPARAGDQVRIESGAIVYLPAN